MSASLYLTASAVLSASSHLQTTPCPLAEAACATDPDCHAFAVYGEIYQLHGCANALVPNNDWTVYVPSNGTAQVVRWTALSGHVNVDEGKCKVHPQGNGRSGQCSHSPAPPAPPPAPPGNFSYRAVGSVDVGTGESSIFMFNNTRYLLDNIFKGWIDHYGKWDPLFEKHSYVRIRELDTGRVVANITETIATCFVSAFVDHRPTGDVLWLSALDRDRVVHADLPKGPDGGCGTGVFAISTVDLVHYTKAMALPDASTCNTEVANVDASPASLPTHRYVMILEPFGFMVNNNKDGNLTTGWVAATGSTAPHAPSGGPSIRHENGRYYVITGGRTVYLCRSKDLGHTDPWVCSIMVNPTDRGGAAGPGDGAVAPYAGFAKDAVRKDFPVMAHDVPGWDWNSNDADVCCTGGSSPSFIIWGASTQGARSHLPAGSPSCTNAVGVANMTLVQLLESFFA